MCSFRSSRSSGLRPGGTEDCAGPPHYRGSPPFSGANAGSTLRPRPGVHHSWEKRGVKTQVFLPRFYAQFYNSLIINAPGNEAWPHPDSHYIRADFKTSYDVLGDTMDFDTVIGKIVYHFKARMMILVLFAN